MPRIKCSTVQNQLGGRKVGVQGCEAPLQYFTSIFASLSVCVSINLDICVSAFLHFKHIVTHVSFKQEVSMKDRKN